MYVPLRVSSPFSIGLGAVKTEELAAFCGAHGLPAAGIADRMTLAGVMTNAKILKGKGIQPLAGITLAVTSGAVAGDLVVYARNPAGYAAVLNLANTVNTRTLEAQRASVDLPTLIAALAPQGADLVVLTGGTDGLLAAAARTGEDLALRLGSTLKGAFPHLFVEIERTGLAKGDQESVLGDIAAALHLPLVATSRALYATPDMLAAYDAYLCISTKTFIDQQDRDHARSGCHLATPAEMEERFADLPDALDNTLAVAQLAGFMIEPATPRTPAFPVTEGTEEDLLRRKAHEGLARRITTLRSYGLDIDDATYAARLAFELDIIVKMGFPGYFLIVADFIGWSRANDIPVGPGRGSGAGSLVAYALGITDIDPLHFGLLFERFLNPDRVSMPDFDIDFCQQRRDEVINYVRGKYGAAHVAQIAAFGTLQARAVVRSVGRVMQLPYPVVDRYAKMIPANPANPIALEEAMGNEDLAAELDKAEDRIRTMFDVALKLEGLFSHVSTHAAGVIISDRPIADVAPVHLDQNGKLATSFEMKAVEAAGLIKFDFLGLKNLDIIHGAESFVKELEGTTIDFGALTYQDQATFAALAQGDGFGVFQLESSGMRRAMRELRVETIEELIALISLYRPGPMDQIATYAAVKSGDEEVSYLHPTMERTLKVTNGVMIYQEQVMELARNLAGYSLGEADLLRRAMGKKIQAEMDAQRERFAMGAEAGWFDIALEGGETRRMHGLEKVTTDDGRRIPLRDAVAEGLEVCL